MYYQLKTLENLTAIIDGVFYLEEWKTISKPIKLNGYQISSFGRIKRLAHFNKIDKRFIADKILSQSASRYLKVSKKGVTFLMHRLVGIHFIPNPKNKSQINHKDLNKLNNHVSNLEWSTQSENNKHAVENSAVYQQGLKHVSYPERNFIRNNFFKIERERLASMFNITEDQVYSIGTNRDTTYISTIRIEGNLRKKKKQSPPVYKPIVDLNTGIFYTSVELAFILGTTRKSVCRTLSEERKPNTTQYRYV